MNLRRGHRIVVSIFVILATLFYVVQPLTLPPKAIPIAKAAWYNTSWNYRQKYIINNPGSLTTDYQFLLDEGIIGRWRMNDNTGTTVTDSSSYGHNGTINGLGAGISWTSSGKYSNALSFGGINTTYVSVGNYDLYNNPANNLSISAWVKTSDSSSRMRILSKGFDIDSWTKGYFLEFNAGAIRLGIGGGTQATSVDFLTTSTSFADNSWHHIVAVLDYNNKIGKLYVDGSAQNLTASTGTCGSVTTSTIDVSSCTAISLNNSNYSLYLGRNDNALSQAWNGMLDEISLYNRPLSADQASYLYNNNISPLLQKDLYAHCQDDGDDLRFTTSDGITEIPHYKELFDGSEQYARIWLKISELANGNNTIYIYYGNSNATTVSSWTNTMSYADDFTDESISASWTVTNGNGTITEAGGDLDFSYSGTSTDWWTAPTGRQAKIIKNNNVPSYNFWAQAKLLSYTVNDRTHAGIGVYDSDDSAYIFGRQDGAANNDFNLSKIGGAVSASYSSTALPVWLGALNTASGFSFWISYDDMTWFPVGSTYSDITFRNFILFGKSWLGNALNFSMDDFFIRRYLANPPTMEMSSYEEIETPSLVFTIEGIGSGITNNGITTDIASTFNTIPFGILKMATPKYAAQKLTVTSNALNGYTVNIKLDGYIQGLYPANKIDPFGATNVSWETPQNWSSPNGVQSNTDSGWVGANTSDTRVTGWSNASGKFGPLSSTAHTIMYSTTKEAGLSKYISFAIETNQYQPSDTYAGTILYNIIPTY